MIKVWTNGCFDILHRGHIEMFRYAKSLGDELVVGIDTDEKVKLGPAKPVIPVIKYFIFLLSYIIINYFKKLVVE